MRRQGLRRDGHDVAASERDARGVLRHDRDMATTARPRPAYDPDEISDAIVSASRLLLEVSTEVLEREAPSLSLADLQVLTMLDRLGPQRLIDIADALEVSQTTATRLADRLTVQLMVDRIRQNDDRREIRLELSPGGAELVASVRRRRRRLVASRLKGLSVRDQAAAIELLARISGTRPDTEEASA
jgi:DNA-binding MarR family transcriptional regulator